MDYFSRKEQIAILIIVLVIIISVGYKFFLQDYLNRDDDLVVDYVKNEDNDNIEDKTPVEIIVHVSGEVYNPGLVTLISGDRVIDAVNLSGGLKNDADSDKINLARKVQDEEKIHIPRIGDESVDSNQGSNTSNPKININACSKSDLESLPGIGAITAEKIIDYRDKNSFRRVEDLMNVSGIGEKKFEGLKDLIVVH